LCCIEELGCGIEELDGLFYSTFTLNRSQGNPLVAWRRLSSICREREIDLIHAHDAASQSLAAIARFTRPRMKLLMTFHRTLGFESARRRDKLRNAFCGLMSEAVVTASEERKRHYLSENAIAPSKLLVIPLGVDLDRFQRNSTSRIQVRSALGIGEQTVVVGTIGHFGPEKGVDLAVQAFNECTSRNPNLDVALVVLGDGTAEQRERIHRVSQVNRSKLIYLAGFQTDVWHWLSAFDIMLHTPRMEAFGLVVVEAMGCMLPVVATAVGSMPEIVREGQTGLVVAPEPGEAIARALARLAQDRDLRHSLGSRAHEVAHMEYSSALCAERYAKVYRNICHGDSDPLGRSVSLNIVPRNDRLPARQ
jgi:glycosyltransferase involved in cell wall biosynthesis